MHEKLNCLDPPKAALKSIIINIVKLLFMKTLYVFHYCDQKLN